MTHPKLTRRLAAVAMAAACAGAIGGAAFVVYRPAPYAWLAASWSGLRDTRGGWQAARAARLALLRANPTPAAVVMLGDSLTAGGEWREWLAGADAINRGIDGDRTDDALARLDTVTAARPRAVFLMLGTNDLASGRPIDAVVGDYRRLVSALRAEGAAVFVQSTLDCATAVCGDRVDAIRRLNEALRALAAETGSTWIDLNATMSTPEGGLRPEHTWDGTHLTASGYAAWRAALRPHLPLP
ncbi:MAG: GDSL-type esterase/lipase family protein [Burkholderiales bacterium]